MEQVKIPGVLQLNVDEARQLIKNLSEAAKTTIKPDSASFHAFERALSTAERKANNLSTTLTTVFKNNQSPKGLEKQFEQLYQMIINAANGFANIPKQDILLPPEAQQQVDNLTQQIVTLAEKLKDLPKVSVGSLLQGKDLTGELKVLDEAAKILGVDLNQLNSADFSKAISSGVRTAQADLKKLQQSTNDTQQSLTGLNNIDISKIQTITQGFTSDKLNQTGIDNLRTQLEAFGQTLTDTYHIAENNNPFSSKGVSELFKNIDIFSKKTGILDRSAAIRQETEALSKAFDEQRKTIEDKIKRLEELEKTRRSFLPNGARSTSQQREDLFNWLKQSENSDFLSILPQKVQDTVNGALPVNARSFDGIRNAVKEAIAAAKEELNQFSPTVKQSLVDQLTSTFNNIPTESIIKRDSLSNLKNALTNELQGLSLGPDIIKGLLSGFNSTTSLTDFINQFQSNLAIVKDGLKLNVNIDEKSFQETEQKLKTLQEAMQTFANAQLLKGASGDITSQIAAFQRQIDDLYAKLQKPPAGIGDKALGNLQEAQGLLQTYATNLNQVMGLERGLGNIQGVLQRWMGFYQIINLTRRAITSMKKHIQDLDAVMTKIAVVTNMTQEDLWGRISEYSRIAQENGVAIQGVYEVSQIFYQQGLQTNEVMELTTETLKMAKLAGLDYATAADYMTTAVRGFKLEMTDAAHVTDVWSALAARTASNTSELAVAISKTASSAESVGASFEATSAMMATMISVTRESATNIGTALKSVIARYGEMKSNPTKLVDSEGEELSLNKVDTALQAVGISLHTVNGEFRDFDDVILELGEKWNTLDSSMQRYIATVMAGNR